MKGRDSRRVDPPQFSLNEREGGRGTAGAGGERKVVWKKRVARGKDGESENRENGKFTSHVSSDEGGGKPPNIPFFDSARWRHARFVLKSFYNSMDERPTCSVPSPPSVACLNNFHRRAGSHLPTIAAHFLAVNRPLCRLREKRLPE